MIVKFHYEEKLDLFIVGRGLCCQRTGVPQLRYVIPVVQYDTDRDGNVLSGNFEIRYLQLSDKQYRARRLLIGMFLLNRMIILLFVSKSSSRITFLIIVVLLYGLIHRTNNFTTLFLLSLNLLKDISLQQLLSRSVNRIICRE